MKRSLDETKQESNMVVDRINLESKYEESKKIVEKDILKCKNLCRYFNQCCREFEEALGLDFVKSILSNEIPDFVDDAGENGENFKDILSFADAGGNLHEPQDDSGLNCEVSTNQTCEEIIENSSEESREPEVIKQEIMIERIARSQQTTPIEEKHDLTKEEDSWMTLPSPECSSFYNADVSENTEVHSSFSYISNTDDDKTLFPQSYSETTEDEFSYSMDESKNFAQSSRIESFVQSNNVEKSSSLLVKSLKNQMRLSLCEKGLEIGDLKAREKEIESQISINENGLDFSVLASSRSEASVVPSLSFLASNSTFEREKEEDEEEEKEEDEEEEKEEEEKEEEDVNRDDSKELCQISLGNISKQNETIEEGNNQSPATANIDKERYLEISAVISCDENETFEANEVTSSFVDIASDYDDKEIDEDIMMKGKEKNMESGFQKEDVESPNHQGNLESRNEDKHMGSDVVLEEYVIIENQIPKEQSSCGDKKTVLGDAKEAAATNFSVEIRNGCDVPKKYPEVSRNDRLREDDSSENASQRCCLQATNKDTYTNEETIKENEIPDAQITADINQDPGTVNDDEFDDERMIVLNIKRKRRKRRGPALNMPRNRKIKSFQKFLRDLDGKKRDDDSNTVSKFRQEPQSNGIRRYRDAMRKSGDRNDNVSSKFSARLRSPLFFSATDILLDCEEEIKPDKVETPQNRSDCFVIMERCVFTAEPLPGSQSEFDNEKAKARETAKRIDDMHAQLFEKYDGLTTDSIVCIDDDNSDGRENSDNSKRSSRSNQRVAKTVGKSDVVVEKSDSRDRSRKRNITKADQMESESIVYLDETADDSENVAEISISDNDGEEKRVKRTRNKRVNKGKRNRKVEQVQKRDSSEKTKEAKSKRNQSKIEKKESSKDSSRAKEPRNEEQDLMEKQKSRRTYKKKGGTSQKGKENIKKIGKEEICQRESEVKDLLSKTSRNKEVSSEETGLLENRSSRRKNKRNARETNDADSENMSDSQSKAKGRSSKIEKEQDLVEERVFSDNSSSRITKSKRQRNKRIMKDVVEDEDVVTEDKIEAGVKSCDDGLKVGDGDKASTANCERKNRRGRRKAKIEREITEVASEKASGSEEENMGTNRVGLIENIPDEETQTSERNSGRRALRSGRKKGVKKTEDCEISPEESCENKDGIKGNNETNLNQDISDDEPRNDKSSGRRMMRGKRKGRTEKDDAEIAFEKISEDSDDNRISAKTILAEKIADEESSSVKDSGRRVLRGKRKGRKEMKDSETEFETTSGNSESSTEKISDDDVESVSTRSKVQRNTRKNNTRAVNIDEIKSEAERGESCSEAIEAPRISTRGKRDAASKTVRPKSELSVVVENVQEDKNESNHESLKEIKENSVNDKEMSSETGCIGTKDKNVVNENKNEEKDSEENAVCDGGDICELEHGENVDIREPGTEESSEGQTTAEEKKETLDRLTGGIVRKKKKRNKLNRGGKKGTKSVLPRGASTPLETKRGENCEEHNEYAVCSGLDVAPTSTEIMAIPNAKEKKSKASKRKNSKTEKEKSSNKESKDTCNHELDCEPPVSKENIDILGQNEAEKSQTTNTLKKKKEMGENSSKNNEDVVCSGLDAAPTSTEIMVIPNAKEKKSKASKRKNNKTEKEKSSNKGSEETVNDELDYEPPVSKEKIDILEQKEAEKSQPTKALNKEAEVGENSHKEKEDTVNDELDDKVSTSEEKIDVLNPKETKKSKKKDGKKKQAKRNRNKVCLEVEESLEVKNNVVEEADAEDPEMEGVKTCEEEKVVESESSKGTNEADNLPRNDSDRVNEEIEGKNCEDEFLSDKSEDKEEELIEDNDLVVENKEPRPVTRKDKSKTTIANNKENGQIEEKNLRRSARKVKPVKRLELDKENKGSILEELPPKRKASGKKEPLKKKDINRKFDDSKIPSKKRRTLFNINKNTSITSVGFSILEDTTLNTTINRNSNANTSFVPPALHNFLRSFVAPKIKKKTL